MTITVWKYDVPVTDNFVLQLPVGARCLHAGTQGGYPRLWVMVDTDADLEDTAFVLVGSGHPIHEAPERLAHIGTFQLHDGALVFHLFQRFDAWPV